MADNNIINESVSGTNIESYKIVIFKSLIRFSSESINKFWLIIRFRMNNSFNFGLAIKSSIHLPKKSTSAKPQSKN